jgi:hypothetical protein
MVCPQDMVGVMEEAEAERGPHNGIASSVFILGTARLR